MRKYHSPTKNEKSAKKKKKSDENPNKTVPIRSHASYYPVKKLVKALDRFFKKGKKS